MLAESIDYKRIR